MACQITTLFDLFRQHCSLPVFILPQYAAEVCTELVESIGKLAKQDKKTDTQTNGGGTPKSSNQQQ